MHLFFQIKTLNIKDAAIVTVRNSSSRLPNKAIMKIKDQLRSIDIVISRAKKTGFAVIIATSTDKTDDVFEVPNVDYLISSIVESEEEECCDSCAI